MAAGSSSPGSYRSGPVQPTAGLAAPATAAPAFAAAPIPASGPIAPAPFDFASFARSLKARYEPPDNSGLLAVLTVGGKPYVDSQPDDADAPDWFAELVDVLPDRPGRNSAFDALVDDPATTTITPQELIAQLS